jgi:hypothetical protein
LLAPRAAAAVIGAMQSPDYGRAVAKDNGLHEHFL